jgi:Recombination endonuclease VII
MSKPTGFCLKCGDPTTSPTTKYCTPHNAAHQRQWRADNPDAARRAAHRQRLARVNLTHTEYKEMLWQQDNACAICKQSFFDGDKTVTVHIDHDHATGAVRGLLCRGCNHGIGNFNDDPERLTNAISYLRHK